MPETLAMRSKIEFPAHSGAFENRPTAASGAAAGFACVLSRSPMPFSTILFDMWCNCGANSHSGWLKRCFSVDFSRLGWLDRRPLSTFRVQTGSMDFPEAIFRAQGGSIDALQATFHVLPGSIARLTASWLSRLDRRLSNDFRPDCQACGST